MRAGRLDRRLSIERKTVTLSATGEPVPSWATLAADLPATVVERSGREALRQAGLSAEVDAVFTIRWLDGLTVADRVVYDGRRYDIAFLRELQRRQGWEIQARHVQAAGTEGG